MHRTASLALVSSAVAVRFAPVFPPDDAVHVPGSLLAGPQSPLARGRHVLQPAKGTKVRHEMGPAVPANVLGLYGQVSQDQCVEHLVFHGGQTHAYSNLGGLGPDTSKPVEMRFRNIGWDHNNGTELDLVLMNETVYKTSVPEQNGVKPGTNVGEITLAMGTDVVMNMSFVEHDTMNLVYLDRAKLTLCDVDHAHIDFPEVYTLDVDAFYIVPEGLEFTYKFMDLNGNVLGPDAIIEETVSALEAGRFVKKIFQEGGGKFRVQVTSGAKGFLCDNPTDFDNLTNITFKDTPACQATPDTPYYNDYQDLVVDQAKRCFAIELVRSASTRFVFQAGKYGVDSGYNRRAFISGASTYFNEDAPCPTPPPTPPPTPLAGDYGGGDHDECTSAKCTVVKYLVDSLSDVLSRLNRTCVGRLNLTSGFWQRRAALGA